MTTETTPEVVHGFRRVLIAGVGMGGLQPAVEMVLRLIAPGACLRIADMVDDRTPSRRVGDVGDERIEDFSECVVAAARPVFANVIRCLEHKRCAVETGVVRINGSHAGLLDALACEGKAWQPDLLAIASTARDASELDPELLSTSLGCPVLFVPAETLTPKDSSLDRVLVAVDDSKASIGALRTAINVLPRESRLRIAYVIDRQQHPPGPVSFAVDSEDCANVRRIVDMLMSARCTNTELAFVEAGHAGDGSASAIELEADRWRAHLVVTSGGNGTRTHASIWNRRDFGRHNLFAWSVSILLCPSPQ